ncbi:hypothetical protein FQA47_022422 [Oryzias melastigma]|uniref:Uncharacterized protein n=1 Tax=Oryzias melastigma TaxID=30732 RepID=A0A834FR07_ORYME|nr:hypothetical protein FQA47_022422 [Oryzias melastigma]
MTKASFSPCGSWEASKARVASPHFPQLSGEWTADLNECVCVEGAALKRRACLWIKARQKIPHVSKNKLSSMLSVTATPKRDGVYGQQRPDAAAASLSETGEHKRPSQRLVPFGRLVWRWHLSPRSLATGPALASLAALLGSWSGAGLSGRAPQLPARRWPLWPYSSASGAALTPLAMLLSYQSEASFFSRTSPLLVWHSLIWLGSSAPGMVPASLAILLGFQSGIGLSRYVPQLPAPPPSIPTQCLLYEPRHDEKRLSSVCRGEEGENSKLSAAYKTGD